MDRLPASDAVALDAMFAGMPRRAFWPAGPVDPAVGVIGTFAFLVLTFWGTNLLSSIHHP